MIDAQAEIAPEAVHAVIPPAEALLRLVEKAKAVLEPQSHKGTKRGTLRFAAQHLAFPRLRVVHVSVFGRDVVIAEQSQRAVAAEFFGQVRVQRLEPGELVLVLVRIDALPVGDVNANHADTIDRRGNAAL